MASPILGGDGNKEFLLILGPADALNGMQPHGPFVDLAVPANVAKQPRPRKKLVLDLDETATETAETAMCDAVGNGGDEELEADVLDPTISAVPLRVRRRTSASRAAQFRNAKEGIGKEFRLGDSSPTNANGLMGRSKGGGGAGKIKQRYSKKNKPGTAAAAAQRS
jgi:hypothetical protein